MCLAYFVMFTRVILTVLVFVLSFSECTTRDPMRTYTLNLYAVFVPSDFMLCCRLAIYIANLFNGIFSASWLLTTVVLADYFSDIVAFQFRVMALMVTLYCYAIFSYPLQFERFQTKRLPVVCKFSCHNSRRALKMRSENERSSYWVVLTNCF
ncbi:hypothetical protein Tcan_18926 [Toxocara canis]|uniref:Uncharacterized protein n=1 Tax=Toxocara canis TaxID=6265 RepID=A0A0B2UIB8_TOXCA|nr:hypothetical protein Tcan_18926 [Toxocara canis]